MLLELPPELLTKVMLFVREPPRLHLFNLSGDYSSDPADSLRSCSLVSKLWSEVAQPLLFESIFLRENYLIDNFHRLLTHSSDKLGRYVRHLYLFSGKTELPTHRSSYHLTPDRMVAGVLQATPELISLDFTGEAMYTITDLVFDRVRSLPKLKTLRVISQIDSLGDDQMEEPAAVFDPRVLNELPRTMDELAISWPSSQLLQLLPYICQNLCHSPLAHTELSRQAPSLNDRQQREHDTGLRSLTIAITPQQQYLASIPLLARTVASSLTSFTLMQCASINKNILSSFLSAATNVQHLRLEAIKISPDLLPGLRLPQLRSLTISFEAKSDSALWDRCCRSLTRFISYSAVFEKFHLSPHDHQLNSSDLLLRGLIEATTVNRIVSTLRELNLVKLYSPSIETIEYLCQSAPRLEHIGIKVPYNHWARAVQAMNKLVHLASVDLNEFSFFRALGGEAVNWRPVEDFFSDPSHQISL